MTLPASIGQLTALLWLRLNGNPLQTTDVELRDVIECMESLESVSFTNDALQRTADAAVARTSAIKDAGGIPHIRVLRPRLPWELCLLIGAHAVDSPLVDIYDVERYDHRRAPLKHSCPVVEGGPAQKRRRP